MAISILYLQALSLLKLRSRDTQKHGAPRPGSFFLFPFFFCARHHTMSHIPPPSKTADLDTISRPSPPHMSRLPLSFTPSLVFFCLSSLPSPYQPDPLCPEDPRHYIGSPASGH
ncbi:hypothetical protein H0G86_011530 [Trichoderma simmonsii]|uniref:Uncharacterized protein n=1 Tax=Trichoderma simmonsii TaxID=1491479 RepID=A0A8G0PME6_9HYPO|nr:hypothetical protein H0G86_011530 [Trichoderma simmonsii]